MDEMKRINDAAEKVLAVCGQAEIGIILGSGLGDYAEALEDAVKLPYSEIPGFPRSTVAGHAGMWCCGTLHGKRVVMMQGRFHYYEGYSMKDVTLPVRVMQKIGVKTLIVTNAAGGVNMGYHPGDLMVIGDMFSLTAQNPLIGPNLDEFGPRFPDMSCAFDKELRALAHECANEQGFALREGVYAQMTGPTYETPAEIRMLRTLEGVAMVEGAARMGNGDFEKTLYTSCFSAKTGTYYYTTYDDPAIRHVSLADAAGAPADKLVCPEPGRDW